MRQADLVADRPGEIVSRAGSLDEENKISNREVVAKDGCIMRVVVCKGQGDREEGGGEGRREDRKGEVRW